MKNRYLLFGMGVAVLFAVFSTNSASAQSYHARGRAHRVNHVSVYIEPCHGGHRHLPRPVVVIPVHTTRHHQSYLPPPPPHRRHGYPPPPPPHKHHHRPHHHGHHHGW